jgi:hypothetical protein
VRRTSRSERMIASIERLLTRQTGSLPNLPCSGSHTFSDQSGHRPLLRLRNELSRVSGHGIDFAAGRLQVNSTGAPQLTAQARPFKCVFAVSVIGVPWAACLAFLLPVRLYGSGPQSPNVKDQEVGSGIRVSMAL